MRTSAQPSHKKNKKSEEEKRCMCQRVHAHTNVKENAINAHTFMCDFFHSRDIKISICNSSIVVIGEKQLILCAKGSWVFSGILPQMKKGGKKQSSMPSHLKPGACECHHLRDLISINSFVLFASCFGL